MKSSAPSRVATSPSLTQALTKVSLEEELRAAIARGDVATFDMSRIDMDGALRKIQARAKSKNSASPAPSTRPPCPK